MTQTVRVIQCNADGTAQVMHIRESACSGDCHKCSGCGAAQETMTLQAENPIQARPGDRVIIESKSGPILAAAAVLYMLPLVLFFGGFLAGKLLWDAGGICGGIAFVLGILISVIYDRRMAKKKNTVYTITRYAQQQLHGF